MTTLVGSNSTNKTLHSHECLRRSSLLHRPPCFPGSYRILFHSSPIAYILRFIPSPVSSLAFCSCSNDTCLLSAPYRVCCGRRPHSSAPMTTNSTTESQRLSPLQVNEKAPPSLSVDRPQVTGMVGGDKHCSAAKPQPS